VSRYEPTTLGTPSLLPKRELLTSQRGADGLWCAHYPTGTTTLCGQPVVPFKALEAWPPTCTVCAETAEKFERIDGSIPEHWRTYKVVPPDIKDAA
jgi:hypothetical protein